MRKIGLLLGFALLLLTPPVLAQQETTQLEKADLSLSGLT
jgi:hypothetical protein